MNERVFLNVSSFKEGHYPGQFILRLKEDEIKDLFVKGYLAISINKMAKSRQYKEFTKTYSMVILDESWRDQDEFEPEPSLDFNDYIPEPPEELPI